MDQIGILLEKPASQEFLLLLQISRIHRHVHKSTPLLPSLSYLNPVHSLSPYFFKIHFNIIRQYAPVFQVVSIQILD
jgi:hypothetical protein